MASDQDSLGRVFSGLNVDNSRQHIYSGQSTIESQSGKSLTGEVGTSCSQPVSSNKIVHSGLSIMLHIMETIPTGYNINRNPRSARNSKEKLTCSQQSVLSAIDRFVKSVNNMDATVLIPSRLRDMDIHSKLNRVLPPGLNRTDLYSFYIMLKDVKNELLWGPSSSNSSLLPISCLTSPRSMPQLRQTSDDGLGSSGSTSDPETDSDFESVITDRGDSMDEQTSHLATAFRHHLQGLHAILHQLADSADYLTARYQEDIDSTCSGF